MVLEICMWCSQKTFFCLHTPGTVWLSLPHLKSNWDIKARKKTLRATSSSLDNSLVQHKNWYFLLCKLSISRRSICIRGGSLWAVSPIKLVLLLKPSTCGYCAPHWRPPFSLTSIESFLSAIRFLHYIVSVFPPARSFPSSAFQFVLFCFQASQDFIWCLNELRRLVSG